MNIPCKTLLLFLLIYLFICPLALAEKQRDYTDPVLSMEFVLIKGGTFTMGDITGRDKYASPAHRVKVEDFYIGKYEVSFEQYDRFCEETGRDKPADEGWGRENRPAINVSWNDARDFARWLSDKTGQNFHLPSEAQWEYAARAGTSTNFWWGSRVEHALANCNDCGSKWDGSMSAPVGSFRANPFGLFDVLGNVYEWCFDTFHENYQGAPTDGSAWLHGDTSIHMSRGGSWNEPSSTLVVSARNWTEGTETKDNTTGFRLAMKVSSPNE